MRCVGSFLELFAQLSGARGQAGRQQQQTNNECRFLIHVSSDDPLNCGDASCLTRCHRGFVSNSCHFFRTPLSVPLARIHALRGADQPVQNVPSRDGHPGYNSRTIQSRWEINVSDSRKCESNPGKHESCPTTTMPSRPADQSGLTASCFTSELATHPGITVNTTAIPGRARFVTATY